MNNPWVRAVIATLAGAIVAVLVVFLTESLGHIIFPPPEGLDITNPDDQARIMEVIPLGAKIAVVVAWFLGSFAGAVVAVMLGKRSLSAWLVALLMIAASVYTTQMFPHPVWMIVAAVALPVVAAWLAIRMMGSRIEA